MGYWLLPSCSLAFLGAWKRRPLTRWAAEAGPPTFQYPRRKTHSCRFCLVFTKRLSWGFQRCPSIGLVSRRPLLLRAPPACAFGLSASACPRQGTSHVPSSWFSTTLAVFSVESLASILHLAADHGVRRVGACSWTTEMIHEPCLSATPHPSKVLHGCSHPPGSFTVPSSPGHLPSCCLLFENRPTSGRYSAARVRGVLRCCHLVPRTTSLGFSFKFLRVDFFPSRNSLRGSDALLYFNRAILRKDSLVSNRVRTALTMPRRRKTRRVAGPFLLFLSFPIGKVRWTAEMVTKFGEVRATDGHA